MKGYKGQYGKYTVRMSFPTIIHEYVFGNIDDKKIIDFCYKQKELNPEGQTISNRGGWHSPFYKLSEDNIISRTLTEGVSKSIFTSLKPSLNFYISYWININCPNSYNTSHTHPDCHFSGVLWIKVPNNSGVIQFNNPQGHTGYTEIESYLDEPINQTAFCHKMTIEPQVGKMLTFPSALRHDVSVNNSQEDRISISYNMTLIRN